jgi:hypothetical protein
MTFTTRLIVPLVFFANLLYAATITSFKTGNWNDPLTWVGTAVPSIADDVVIVATHTVSIDAPMGASTNTIKSLTVNGKLVYATTVNFTLGDFNNRTSAMIVNGTFEFTGGYGFKIYGFLKFNTGSVFKMYAGGMIINGTLGAFSSVPAGQALLDVTDITTLDVYRCTITLTNPHYDPLTPCIKGAKRFGNTIEFGAGVTPDVNNDFLVSETSKPWFSTVGVNIVNTPTVTSRFKATDIQIDSGVVVENGTFYSYVAATPIKVKGDFNISPNVKIIGNIEFNGTMQQNINPKFGSGATLVTFNGDIIVNNPIEVKSKINVTIQGGDLRFTQGKFDTENKTLTLERTPIGVTTGSYIVTYNLYQDIGSVLIKNLVGNTLFPVGTGNPAYYTPVWVNATSGNFKVSLTPFVTTPSNTFTVPSSYNYVNLKWSIERLTGTANAGLTFLWNTANEVSGFSTIRPACAVFYHNGTTWTNLTPVSGATSTGSEHTKTITNTSAFTTFAVFASVSLLPVEMTVFSGKQIGNRAQLSWTTASEKDVQGFEIEKNTEGGQFAPIGFVKSKNSSNSSTNYEFWDDNFHKTAYYRLKTTDLNGKDTYSKTITIENTSKNAEISVFPNPILRGGNLNIKLADSTNANDDVNIEIYNANGQLMAQEKGIAPIETDYWDSGVYFVKIVNNVNVVIMKVIKE